MGHHGWLPTRRGIPRTEAALLFLFFSTRRCIPRTGAPVSWIFKPNFSHVIDFLFPPPFLKVSPAVLVPSTIALMEKSMDPRKDLHTRSTHLFLSVHYTRTYAPLSKNPQRKKYNVSLWAPGRECIRVHKLKKKKHQEGCAYEVHKFKKTVYNGFIE